MSTHRLVEGCSTGTSATSQLEAVTVLAFLETACFGAVITSVPGPAVVDDNGVVDHVEVPVVVAVSPCTASVELRSGTGKQLAGETVGIAAAFAVALSSLVVAGVVVLVGVAVDDLVVAAIGVAWIELRRATDGERLGLLDAEVLEHAYLQARVVVPAEDATLDDVVRALHLHAVVLGVLEHQSVESPVVCQVVDVDATGHLEAHFGGVVHARAVDNDLANSIFRPGTQFAAQVGRGLQGGNLDALADVVSSLVNEDAVASLHQLHRLVDGQ